MFDNISLCSRLCRSSLPDRSSVHRRSVKLHFVNVVVISPRQTIWRNGLLLSKNVKKRNNTALSSTLWLVCYTAVFSEVTQRSSPLTAAENRTTFLSRNQPIIIQLTFSGRCSRHLCGIVTPPVTALLLSLPHV